MAEQSRRMSFVESVANVAIGYGIAFAHATGGFPAFGCTSRWRKTPPSGRFFTVVSIVRSYACAACSSGCA